MTRFPNRRAIGAAAAAVLVAGCASVPSGDATRGADGMPTKDIRAGCSALAGVTIPAGEIGVGTALKSGAATVASATWVGESALKVAPGGPTPAARITPALPAHCRVLGSIAPVDPKAPPIHFQVNLPAQWNGRSLQYGGGGFNGTLITGTALLPAQPFDSPAPLARGFVTVGTDSGHQNAPGVPPQAFALNDEALVNFAHASYKKVRDVSVALMQRGYGRGPTKLYFAGSSEGGREGVMLAQRYANDFDGIFARVPVLNWTGLQFAGSRNGAATFGDGWLRPAQVKRVHDAVLAACDGADGLVDGIVGKALACKQTFDVTRLRCAPGAAAADDSCLSDAQVKAVQALHSPYRFPFTLANGITDYPGWPVGGEAAPANGPTGGWNAWWLGSAPPTFPPAPNNGIGWFYGAGAYQYFYARDPQADPREPVRMSEMVPRVQAVSALMDATDPDLSAFEARGGKLIVMENLADYAQSPYAGIQYVESVHAKLGRARASNAVRLITAPGVDHVGAGAPGLVDILPALVDWVERGKAPTGLTLAEQQVEAPHAVLRMRPACEWPQWPKYVGGDASKATSFTCAH